MDLIEQAMTLQTNLLTPEEREKIETEMRTMVNDGKLADEISEAFKKWFDATFPEGERRHQALQAAGFDFEAFWHHKDINNL